MSGGAIAGIVIAGVAVIVLIWGISVYNSLIKKRNNVNEGFSTMDVYLKKRYDLIPNLVETVKGYIKHENETLTKVMEARYAAMNAQGADDKVKKENHLTSTLKTLYKVTENYPNLKADTHFTSLMNTLKSVEGEIENSRKYYNAVVKEYTNARELFPRVIIAKMFKFEPKPLFEVDEPEERKNVHVKF